VADIGQLHHRGQRAVQRLVEVAPASGSLALWVRHANLSPDQAQQHPAGRLPAFTDGATVFYTPAFEALALEEQTGWVAHEVLHIAFRHAQRHTLLARRTGNVDLALFNRCADAIVNSTLAHLAWLTLPAGALLLEDLLDQVLHLSRTPEAALLEWDVERLYAAVDDRAQDGDRQRDGPRAARARALGGTSTGDLRPDPTQPDELIAEAEQAREWGDRLLRGHSGDGAFSILRTLGADLPRVHTPWEQVLRTQAARALSQQPDLSWSRPTRSWLANQGRLRGRPGSPARRMPWEPGRTTSRAVPRVVLVLDLSGSIEATLLDRFAAEMNALSRRLQAALVLVAGDDRVRHVQQLEPGAGWPKAAHALDRLQTLAWVGGGDTDFTPLLEEADRHRPDLTVVLTDLQGPARHRPQGQVLWAVPPAFAAALPPFGRLLVLR
jgi:predicted metal-dependent peptidase